MPHRNGDVLRLAMQEAAYCSAEGNLSAAERPSFTTQKITFCKVLAVKALQHKRNGAPQTNSPKNLLHNDKWRNFALKITRI